MILDLPFILETRRNHALEHATLHVLARTHKGGMAGYSTPIGFFLLGDLTEQEIWVAATEALERLNEGESELAVHKGCGTNIATTILLSASMSWFVVSRVKSTIMRIALIPIAAMFGFIGALIARRLGPALQRKVTTEANMGGLHIVDVVLMRKGVHRVITA